MYASNLFKIENVAFEYNDTILFKRLNFSLKSGEALIVKGKNGTGKTTLLRILSGLLTPLLGDIQWNEQSIFKYSDAFRIQLGYLGHQNGIRPHLTVKENLQWMAMLRNKKLSSQKMNSLLITLKLSHLQNEYAFYLSAGQARRLALVRFLIDSFPLWILDEPTTALDQEGLELLKELMNEHLSRAGMLIVATHQLLLLPNAKQVTEQVL